MPKRKWNLDTIYISERLQEGLRPISRCTLTTVVAPMGYGKTTAVNWYLGEREKIENPWIVRISVYSDNLAIFWKSVQDAFAYAGFGFLHDYPCPTDAASGSLLTDDFCHELASERSCYIFIDDFHLLTDNRVPGFLCVLANRLPKNVHLIIAGRDRFLPMTELVRLGSRVYQIGTEQLRLNHTELAVYAHRCGTDLSEKQLETLLYSSEGWFSAIYLNLRTLYTHGELPKRNSDIYTMFTAAMIEPLSEKQREFLAVMGLADEFTVEMARFVTGIPDAEDLISTLTEQNAFVKCLPDGVTFRFHHMMKECAERTFRTLDAIRQIDYHNRFGSWYESHRQYLHAMSAYRRSGNYDALLCVIQNDAGVLMASLKSTEVMNLLEQCPVSVLKEHPQALLVLMRRMFTWQRIPKMMELRELLITSIAEHPQMSQEERGNLLGESDLIMSFLMYNDIMGMSRFHRSASAQMSRPAISIDNKGGWTFGSPSVLMMFHREPGELPKELTEMDECMPYYYKITNGHGQGAEKIMRAEAAFMQGRFTDAQIELESAYAQIEGNGQENMVLCCDFLALRLSLCADVKLKYTVAYRREELIERHNIIWIHLFDSACAYYYALTGQMNQIPALWGEHRLSTVNFLSPGKPMMELIENQVYLAQGDYAKVIGRVAGLFDMCEGLHYGLVKLHLCIQVAAAYEMLGKRSEALEMLGQAIQDAAPDNFLLPFVENYGYLKILLESCAKIKDTKFIRRIIQLGNEYEVRQVRLREQVVYPMILNVLTEREREIVRLMTGRLSNREIAEKLFLSEGSVKQYVNQIYSKLHIEGDTRTKRQHLFELIANNKNS